MVQEGLTATLALQLWVSQRSRLKCLLLDGLAARPELLISVSPLQVVKVGLIEDSPAATGTFPMRPAPSWVQAGWDSQPQSWCHVGSPGAQFPPP